MKIYYVQECNRYSCDVVGAFDSQIKAVKYVVNNTQFGNLRIEEGVTKGYIIYDELDDEANDFYIYEMEVE